MRGLWPLWEERIKIIAIRSAIYHEFWRCKQWLKR